MSYVAKRLGPGEAVVVEGRFHWLQYLMAWAALVFLGIFVVGIVIFIKEMARLNTTDFVVTNRRVILKRGWMNVHLDELTLNSIEGAHIDRSILGRLFGYGKLELHGRGDTHMLFPTMARPDRFRSAIESARISEEARPLETAVKRAISAPPPKRRLTRKEQRQLERQARHAH